MGLVARVIEEARISTAILSWIPELSESVGAPRVVGIGFPGSVPFGRPGETDLQLSILRASLDAAVSIDRPGGRVDLAFEWPAGARVPKPPQPPPISRAIMKRPWLFLKLLNGEVPPS